jgi:electron transfer flavoprotein alpha subunit
MDEYRHTERAGPPAEVTAVTVGPEIAVVRRSGQGWRVGDEELTELTSAMVLADLLAAEQPAVPPPPRPPAESVDAAAEAERLRVTVAQLESALVRRVKVEQAIGIVCERRHVPPARAFELIRQVARADGTRVAELAARIVDSATNPLLTLPDELARPLRQPRLRGKSPRHVRVGE